MNYRLLVGWSVANESSRQKPSDAGVSTCKSNDEVKTTLLAMMMDPYENLQHYEITDRFLKISGEEVINDRPYRLMVYFNDLRVRVLTISTEFIR